jgi:hypothetical protein
MRLTTAEFHGGVLRGFSLGLALLLPLGLTGCLFPKKVKAPVIPQAKVPVILEPSPEPDPPMMVEALEPPDLPIPIAEAAATPRPRRRAVARSSATPASSASNAQVAAAEVPDESLAIGELTGGDVNPQTRQEAADLIASNDKRLKALSAGVLRVQRSQVSKIRNFQKQAQDALNSGDSEGAMTLATKAKLLLYELDHGAS